ncbi:VOC family protein [Mesorhizobium sp. CAU 1732]|uniref:VOC family protein n=1 Tax=Mesorhizobium sp. CAU 1732 TaxID=3140358 RepID=UPI0032611143
MNGGRLATVTLLVRDYDEALAWYRDCLDFAVMDDVDLGQDKRWVVVAPDADRGARFLLARAEGDDQVARIGDQTGGRVGFFIETDDFDRDHARMRAKGVAFREEPRREAYGTVAVFADLYGNLFDLIEPRKAGSSKP